jgi:death-on-curing protein
MAEPDFDFLTFEDIEAIHEDQLARHGGAGGIIEENVVKSSVAAAQWEFRFGGDVADCAAAYLYHFAVNQGFADGNKRTGVVAAIEFLGRNGYKVAAGDLDMYDLTMRVVKKLADKNSVADWFRQRLESMP